MFEDRYSMWAGACLTRARKHRHRFGGVLRVLVATLLVPLLAWPAAAASSAGDVTVSGAAPAGGQPDAPLAPGVAEGDRILLVRWEAPADNGRPFTTYNVDYCKTVTGCDDPTEWMDGWYSGGVLGPLQNHTITGLTNGTEYAVRVRAVNGLGAGPWSKSVNGTPKSFAAPTLTVEDGSIAVRWTYLSGTHHFRVFWTEAVNISANGHWPAEDDDRVNYGVPADPFFDTSYTIEGLSNGTEYAVRVKSLQQSAIAIYSATAQATPRGEPDPPAAPGLTPGDGELTASWSAPADGGSPITGYRVQWTLATDTGFANPISAANGPGTTHRITGLTNGTEYAVRVQATNVVGGGVWSPAATAAPAATATPAATPPPATEPDPSAVPGLTPGDGELTASWSAPADGGSPITGYQVQWTLATDTGFANPISAADGPDTTHRITGLTNGTEYAVRVQAVNAVGPGAWSAAATATPVDPTTEAQQTRNRQLSRAVLPRLGQALVAGPLRGVTARAESLGRDTPAGLTYQVGGQTRLREVALTLGRSLDSGRVDLAQVLGGSAFSLALSQAGREDAWAQNVVLWGQGMYQHLTNRADPWTGDWAGGVLSGQVGVDARLHPQVLTGVLVNWGQGAVDWQAVAGEAGKYEVTMTSVHPYVGWRAADGDVEGWGTAGYGWGSVALEDDLPAAGPHSDAVLTTAAVGLAGRLLAEETLLPGGRTNLRAKGDVAFVSLEVEGAARLLPVTVETQRLRALLEVVHERPLAGGGQWAPSVEVGLRHDGGDGQGGTGLETGLGLRYQDPAWGMMVNGQMRFLTLSSAGYEEWGGAVQVQVDPGPRAEGAQVSLTTAYGASGSGVERLWKQEMPSQGGLRMNPVAARVAAEVGYGVVVESGGLNGVLVPYSGVTVTGAEARAYRIGGRLLWGESGVVSLEGAQQDMAGGLTNHQLLLEGRWQF